MDEGEQKPAASTPQNAGSLITNLLSGDNGQKILMALVLVAGGGNILNTNSGNKVSQDELQNALHEIHDLHEALDGMKDKQRETWENAKAIRAAVVKP